MASFRILPVGLVLICLPLAAQAPGTSAPFREGKPVVQPVRPMPFPAGPGTLNNQATIEFRSADRMTPADRDLVAGAEASIAQGAGFAALGFNQGRWSYTQIVCPAFPNHLFLRYTRNNGVGDVSMFSVSIPRPGEGRVRIIPILRRSYSLWSPAPVNAITIAAFNHIRAEDPSPHPLWLATALCYAALAGADPQAAPLAQQSGVWEFPAGPPSVLVSTTQGGAVVRFTDVAARPHPMQWTMTFNAGGKLLKTRRERSAMVADRVEHPAPVHEQPIPPAPMPITVRPVVQASAPPAKPTE